MTITRYGFWHGNSPNTKPEACWEKYSGGRFQEIFRVDKGQVYTIHPVVPLPPPNISMDSLEMGKFYARFCLPGEVIPTQIFGVGESLDPNDLGELPDPDKDWKIYEDAFYRLVAAKLE